jgi:hypothetical protein
MAWALGLTNQWWEPFGLIVPAPPPEYFWPDGVANESSVEAYAHIFRERGFVDCESGDHEKGMLKIALYTRDGEVTHVARQLPNGRWTSKLGKCEDIEHTLEGLVSDGPFAYGAATHFFRRLAVRGK